MSLYFDTKQFNLCLQLGKRLYSELKKLDDKGLLVEIQLTESKVSPLSVVLLGVSINYTK